MKNILICASLIAVFFLAACSGNDTKSFDESLSPATAIKPVTPLTIADTLLSDTATPRMPNQVSVSSPAIPATTLSGNSSTTKAGMNPEHGKPGHRCDIAVGAPLSSPVNSPASSTPQVQTVTAPATSPSTNSVLSGAGVKLNPEHGQPGHDCSVEVGKPLKN